MFEQLPFSDTLTMPNPCFAYMWRRKLTLNRANAGMNKANDSASVKRVHCCYHECLVFKNLKDTFDLSKGHTFL